MSNNKCFGTSKVVMFICLLSVICSAIQTPISLAMKCYQVDSNNPDKSDMPCTIMNSLFTVVSCIICVMIMLKSC